MVGMERTILPPIAEQEFHLAAKTAVLSFIVVFGVTKALTNYLAGRLSDRFGRKHVLVAGWLVAAPVPFLLMWAPSWGWVLVGERTARREPGAHLVDDGHHEDRSRGPREARPRHGPQRVRRLLRRRRQRARHRLHRGALRPAARSRSTSASASSRSGSLLSALVVRETKHHVAAESKLHGELPPEGTPTPARGLLAHDAPRQEPIERQPGRPRQQPERRHGVGPLSALLHGGADGSRADRNARGHLSGDLGHRAALHRAPFPIASVASG